MGYKKRLCCLLMLWVMNIMLWGCWNYNEIGEKAVVMAVAVDYDRVKDEIVLSAEIATPKEEKGKMTLDAEVITASGKNFFDAARNAVGRIGKRLFWSHAKVLIFGQDLVDQEDKFIGTLDWFKRDQEVRDDIWIVLSKEKTAKELLTETDLKTFKITGLYLEDMLNNQKSVSRFNSAQLYQFIDELAAEGISPTIPTARLITIEDKRKSELGGTEVFKGIKSVGWLNPLESKGLLFVIDKFEGGVIVIQDHWENQSIRVTLEVFKSKTERKILVMDEELMIEVDVKTMVNIAEIDSDVDILTEENRQKFKQHAEDKIEKEIEAVIRKVQKEYKSDIFGFGLLIQREHPELWQRIKSDWNEIFPKVKTKVNVELDIRGSAMRSKPTEVKK